ncbi:hypothetical protein QYE76_017702 [Lolium multiflorum]|uniref:CCHC-type domain-containing protein n=1 Tax=Lolium multiflorum TaxID=4521 RepID=A0AAD8UVR7_LOLMU|nr:hypothetical protein QYE76_017702 [Lolium multiflorum]
MAKGSTVPPTMEPNISRGDKDEDEYEEDDWVVSLRDKGMSVFKVICKDKIASSHFFEILTTAIESQKLIWMHENTIDKKGALEREYADDVASLKNELEEEQTTKEALEETFALELSREKENHDRALEMANELKLKNDKLVFVNAKLLEDFEQLKKGSRVIESALAKLTESHEQLKASYLKKHANLPSPITTNNDACATNSTSCEASILKENVELRAQLDLLTCNYGKLEENHGKLSSSHEDLLASHDRLKARGPSHFFDDLVKGHEGKCKLDTMLSMQQSPNDKSGLGFKSNNKNKSKNNNKKKGQVQVKDPAKIVCFKCNIEGHHVRSCPLKKKQRGKRPQAQTHIQPQVEEIPLPKKKQANAPIVEKPSEKKEKKRTCYICREKGHISSLCTIGTSSNSITIDDVYSLRLNFSSRNLLDSAAGGTFMSITLGAATKLLDDMMINYSEWHTERTPQGKKVNSVEETSSLGDKIDAIMSMLANGRSHIDPNNVPLASLVAQEENVDVNFIKNNNFNNNAYRNNYGNNNFRPYPSNSNGYGNSYGNSYNNNKSVPSGLEAMLKEFISTQTAFNKTVEEKLDKIDILASKVDSLALDVDLLKLKVMSEKVEDARFAKTNAIQVRINDNIRLLAELHARWDREEKEKLAKENNVAKVWTITTTSNVDSTHVAAPPTINGKIIGVGNVSTPSAKRTKLPETAVCDKTAEIFQNIGDNDSIAVEHNGLDFDDCHITEVIKFLQKLARSPNASAINLAFTKHITNALIKAREEKLKLEASIPRKLEDGWEPIIKMKFNDFECNALCDLGASISVMPKKIYDMLDLPPLKNCYLDVNLADNVKKKPLGRIDNVRITVNNNLVPVDFVVLDIECNASCPIVLGRPFLRTVGVVIDMREGNIKYQFPLKKGMEHFPRKRMKLPFDFIIRTSYDVDVLLDVT